MKKLLGYTDRLTVRPGEEIEFKVSSSDDKPYAGQLVKLINGDIHSEACGFKEIEIASSINGNYRGREQPIVQGSCIIVEDIQPLDILDEFTLTINFMPTTHLFWPRNI